jgi:hypothetical protein
VRGVPTRIDRLPTRRVAVRRRCGLNGRAHHGGLAAGGAGACVAPAAYSNHGNRRLPAKESSDLNTAIPDPPGRSTLDEISGPLMGDTKRRCTGNLSYATVHLCPPRGQGPALGEIRCWVIGLGARSRVATRCASAHGRRRVAPADGRGRRPRALAPHQARRRTGRRRAPRRARCPQR